ncbi:MAG: DNA polymerase I, partial [Balneolales bacterium]|nr:DNA polymerase I [Balneolales bacterium]
MSKKLLFLLDGMALAYRAHFAFINANLKNSKGIPTGPVLGFANTLEKMLADERPTHIAVAWDTHAPTFRHEADESYKAQRPPQPEELTIGIPLIKDMLEAWGIRNIEQDGYEADDIIGTIATQANAEDVDVMLVTPDKDFMQLVHDHIKMMKPNNKTGGFDLVDREGVKEYFGVYPEKVIDVLAILGDTVDNIPGVPGIGKKGAPALIERFGSLEECIAQADIITAKRQREGLKEFADQAMHAKFMVTIKTDVPDTIEWEGLEWKFDDPKPLGLFFKKMEFRTLTRKYLAESGPVADSAGDQVDLFGSVGEGETSEYKKLDIENNQYELVTSIDRVKELANEIQNADVLCFDTETDSPNPISAGLVGLSFSVEAGTGSYIPVNVEGGLEEADVLEALKPVFQNERSIKVAHNYKFDYTILMRHGIDIKGKPFDTMVAAYLVDASQKIKMDELSKKYLGYEPVPIVDLIGKGKAQKSMADLTPEQVYQYACEDA